MFSWLNSKSVTCSFAMDRDIYNAYKSIVVANGENVKGNIVRYMQSVIQFGTSNADTMQAIEEVEQLKNDHVLIGNYVGCRECHITPDWLLVYEISNDELILYLTRTGTNSDLF